MSAELLDRSARGRRRGLPAGRRAPSPRAAAALLPDARLAPRRGGRLAGHVARRLAWPHGVRGALITADVVVPGATSRCLNILVRNPEAAGREPLPPGVEVPERAAPARRSGWSPIPTRCWVGPTSRPARRPLRGERSHLDRVPRTPGAVGAPAGCPHPARRPRLPRSRSPRSSLPARNRSPVPSNGCGCYASKRLAAAAEHEPPPRRARPRNALVDRLTRAYESGDIGALVALLADDVAVTMPPMPLEYHGIEHAARLRRHHLPRRSHLPPHRDPGQRPAGIRHLRP